MPPSAHPSRRGLARSFPAPDERACPPYAHSTTLSRRRSPETFLLITTWRVVVPVVEVPLCDVGCAARAWGP